ncbi:MAG TPA: MerR family transcriptional regulator [Thermoleophilaceae bacterium]
MQEKLWKIGELAKATGLTVRTLHHYDEIGLLAPSERTQAGHRLYGEDDVRRLYEIRALRDLGLPLQEIPAALDGDPRTTLENHLKRVEQDVERTRRLQSLLQGILDRAGRASGHDYMEAIQAMTMLEQYYTPEQLEKLEQHRDSLGDEAEQQYHRDWAELIATAKEHYEKRTDPSDPAMQDVARRWRELIELFTQGDPEILESLKTMYQEEGPERASQGQLDSDVMQYVGRAIALQL